MVSQDFESNTARGFESVFNIRAKQVQILRPDRYERSEIDLDMFNIMDKSSRAVKTSVERARTIHGSSKRSFDKVGGVKSTNC